MSSVRIGYDVFLSHSHADRAWVHRLAAALADHDHNGRPLRPWLDEKVLDPGELSGKQELTSALDRSRALAIVWTSRSAASDWVQFELSHFEKHAKDRAIIHIEREPGSLPPTLGANAKVIDATDPTDFERQFAEVVGWMYPAPSIAAEKVEAIIDLAFDTMVDSAPDGLADAPTDEADVLLAALLRHDIADPNEEGPAIVAFARAALRVSQLVRNNGHGAYIAKMVFGDCLAEALLTDRGYRQVMQRMIDAEDDRAADPALLFAVARAASKLAELDPDAIDPSALVRTAAKLDNGPHTEQRKALAVQLGRVIGKVRDTETGIVMLDALSRAGAMARLAYCAAVTMRDVVADSTYTVTALAERAAHLSQEATTRLPPPSSWAVSQLSMLDTFEDPWLAGAIANARYDLSKYFGIDDVPYPSSLLNRRRQAVPTHAHLGPFTGRIVRATTMNMVDLASRVGPGDVVYLTEPRVVDALFDTAGAILTGEQDPDAPQIKRLSSRAIPYAIVPAAMTNSLRDQDSLSFEGDHMVTFAGDRW